MTINYDVRAQVVDIRRDAPRSADAFLVDTNVWFWMAYPRASQSGSPPMHYQISDYPKYVLAALNVGADIFQSGLSLAELAHLIEKTEREIYGSAKTKEYRHNTDQRAQVYAEIQTAWSQVTSLAKPLAVVIDDSTVTAALGRLQSEKVDGYDLFILESMKRNNIPKVITDDGDFSTVPGIQLYTANRGVIEAARVQGKLVTRK